MRYTTSPRTCNVRALDRSRYAVESLERRVLLTDILPLTTFAGGLPAGWAVQDGSTDSKTWTHTNPGGRVNANWTGAFMIVDSDNAGLVNMDESLITTNISTIGYENVVLTFKHFFDWYSGSQSEKGDVDYRIGTGAWQNLTRFESADASGLVTVPLPADANNKSAISLRWHYYNAFFELWWGIDDVKVTATSASAPEINVRGNTLTIADNDTAPDFADHTHFGGANVSGGAVTRTYTIQNVGGGPLTLSGATPVTVNGGQAGEFAVAQPAASSIPAGGSTTFDVTFDPVAAGPRTTTLNIASNDADENPYNFTIRGTGVSTSGAPLLYVLADDDATFDDNLLTYDLDTGTATLIQQDVPFPGISRLETSPAGVLYGTSIVNTGLYIIDQATGALTTAANFTLDGTPITPTSFTFKPDGSLLVHEYSNRTGTFKNLLFTGNAATGQLALVGEITGVAGVYAIEYGNDVLYGCYDNALYAINAATTAATLIGTGTSVYELDFGGDGVLRGVNLQRELRQINVATATSTVITTFVNRSPSGLASINGNPPAAPVVDPEPTYTPGTSNTISWGSASGAAEFFLEWDNETAFNTPDGNSGWVAVTNATATGLVEGLYSYRVKARNAAGESGWSNVVSSTQDGTPPTVVSITRVGGPPSNASSVAFNVSFSESVSGVSADDFSVNATGLAGASIGSISGDGSVYTVNVITGTGDGTLGLNLTDDDSIVDVASNPLGGLGIGNGSAVGETYSIDKTRPTAVVSPAAGQTNPANSSPVRFSIIFSEPVFGFSGADVYWQFPASSSSGFVTGSGTTYELTINGLSPPSDGYVNAVVLQNGATDTAGNGNLESGVSTVVFDVTAPTANIVDISPDPRTTAVASISIVFSEPISGLGVSDFDLTRDGGTDLLTESESLSTTDNITWTLSGLSSLTAAAGNYTLTLASAGAGVADVAGNALAAGAADTWAVTPPWLALNSAANWNSATSTLTVFGAATIIADPGIDAPVVVAAVPAAVLTINPASELVVHVDSLNLSNGATASVTSLGGARTAANHRVLVVDGLNIDAASTLDMTDNDLILSYSGASPIANVEADIASGYNLTGNWLGNGITSSTAAADGNFTVAVADNAALAASFGSAQGGPLFCGVDVDLTTVLVKFTHRADVNLDGVIDPTDAAIFGTHYSEDDFANWAMGDLDYDGLFTPTDAAIFGTFFDESLPAV